MYEFIINGKRRMITYNKIYTNTEQEFQVLSYYGHSIHVTTQDDYKDYPKPWYAYCQKHEGAFATIVDGWVGETKQDAIKVCLENIFYINK